MKKTFKTLFLAMMIASTTLTYAQWSTAGNAGTNSLKLGGTSLGEGLHFVTENNYKLPSLAEVEAYITANKHLPNVPSEAEVLKNGIDVANMQAMQQQKIEELTLYLIQLKKEMEAMKAEMELLKQ